MKKEELRKEQWLKKPSLQDGELVIFSQEQAKTSTCFVVKWGEREGVAWVDAASPEAGFSQLWVA